MDWTGAASNPVLNGDISNTLKIYGSLKFITAMSFPYTGFVYFSATTLGHTVTTGGQVFQQNAYFEGAGGGWTLLDSFNSIANLTLMRGSLNTNNQTVNAYAFTSSYVNTRSLSLGSSVFNVQFWEVFHTNATFNCGTSTINTGNFVADQLVTETYYDVNFTYPASALIFGIDNHSGTIQFHNVSFAGSGKIMGNNVFNTLTMAAGKTYELESAKTQTITSVLNASAGCNGIITIRSYTSGSQANISKSSGSVVVNYVSLKDINATGGAVFTANNAVNLGNNTGWTINTVSSQNLYWVGGSGNWSDQSHWSTTSGGAGGACLPTPYNDVFFDGGSGFTTGSKTVTINVGTAFCRSMDWTGAASNPVLNGDISNTLKIYGSLKFITAMSFPYTGFVYFSATTLGHTVTTGGQVFQQNAYFEGAGGGWTLQDSFNSIANLTLMRGSLNTNNQTVNAYAFTSSYVNARSLVLGSSVFNVLFWEVFHTNLTFNCGTSTINTGNFVADQLVTETYYDVNFNNAASALIFGIDNHSGTIQFHNVSFAGSGKIMGNNVFSTLTMAAGKTYELESAKTQTITSVLNASAGCNGIITIRSYTSGSQANISKSSGSVVVNYVSLKDINATGGAVFTANNAVNLGNNTGWTINTVSSQNLYWVGGSGNWSDQSHWSTTSGGAGGACLPTPYNDVFFDAGSGFTTGSKTVTINVGTAFCRSMDWTGAASNPVLNGDISNTLKIYGSLKFITAMSFPYTGFVYFSATTLGHTVTTGGQVFQQNAYFEGASGGWTLLDSFNSIVNLTLMRGSLNTNNQTVNAYAFTSSYVNARSLVLGSSVFNVQFWEVFHTNLTFNCGTSTINTGNFVADQLVTETYYDVNFNNAASALIFGIDNHSGTIQFHNVSFAGSGKIMGTNVFNTLTMAAGKTYDLESAKTQTIQNRWNVQGSCISYILLKSYTNGSFANVSKASGAVTGFNIHMQDIHASGGATFYAYNSTDLGGNTGWNFATLPPLSNAGTITGITTVCAGQTGVVYHLSPTAGAISYTWTVPPGASITSSQGDTIITVSFIGASSGNVTVTASNGCATSATSILPVTVNSAFVPAVTIATGSTTICTGTSVTFAASATNGGSSPVYQWKVNGTNVGTNSPTFTTTSLNNGDQVTVELTSSLSCALPPGATSNTITMSVTAAVTPAVSIAANPPGTVCAGTAVTFTATPVNTGGGAVNYDFKVNGSSVQNGSSNLFTSSTLTNGNTVRCDITISGAACISAASAISNTISMLVNAVVTPTVSVSASQPLPVCIGTWITFTATAGNTGGGSINYDFKVNGSSVQSSSFNSYATASLVNGNTVTCEITISGGSCLTASTAVSNTITMAVNNPVTPAVSIIASPGTNSCTGTFVMIGAGATNTGGGAVNYNFKVNGITVQNGPATFFWTSTLTTGSTVECDISITGGTCLTSSTAQSNILTMTVNNFITPTVNITANPGNSVCTGTLVTFTAVAANTGGGSIINYAFKVNGTTVQNGASNIFSTATLTNGNTVSCEVTIVGGTCLTTPTPLSNNIIMAVGAPATPNVTVTVNPGSNVCSGQTVAFIAGVTGNGGGTVQYDFRINGTTVQNGPSNIFSTSTLATGDKVDCSILVNGGACISSNTALSNMITMLVNASVTPAVAINASPAGPTCTGTPVTFTASPMNGGSVPNYQWYLNAVPTGINSPTYTSSSLTNGDHVYVTLGSNAACITLPIVVSNNMTVSVNPPVIPSVSISADAINICPGIAVTFTAIPINAGIAPSYQWKVNGINTGNNSATYINDQLRQGDLVTCNITAITLCNGIQSAISNGLNITVNPVPVITFNPANPSTISGNPVHLNAIVSGNISSYLWTPFASLSNATIPDPVAWPRTTTTYNLHVVSQDNCVADKTITVLVYNDIYIPNSFTPDGNTINDIFRIPPGTSLVLHSFTIYNRYGNEVFRTNNINEGWDGLFKGTKSPEGTYTYLIKGTSQKMPVLLQGTVILIR